MQSMRHMNDMMTSLFNDPFGMMAHPRHNAITHANHRDRSRQDELQILPFGFPPFHNMFTNFVR